MTEDLAVAIDDPALATGFRNWRGARTKCNQDLADNDPTAVGQKWYTRGEAMGGLKPNPLYLSKLRPATPRTRQAETQPARPAGKPPPPDPKHQTPTRIRGGPARFSVSLR